MKRTAIVAFCLWHMFAVGAYLLPRDNGLYGKLVKISSPYILLLSQWQKWDIFSPDPLRRVSEYRIERNAGDRWELAKRFDFESLSILHRAKELKVLGRLEGDWGKLTPAYILSLCPSIPQSEGTELRLIVDSVLLPSDLSALKRIATTKLEITERIMGSIRCPRRLAIQ